MFSTISFSLHFLDIPKEVLNVLEESLGIQSTFSFLQHFLQFLKELSKVLPESLGIHNALSFSLALPGDS